MVIPLPRVVERVCCCLVLVQVPVCFFREVWQGLCNAYEYCNNGKVLRDGSWKLHSAQQMHYGEIRRTRCSTLNCKQTITECIPRRKCILIGTEELSVSFTASTRTKHVKDNEYSRAARRDAGIIFLCWISNYCFGSQHISRNQANRWRSEPALLYSLNSQLINPMPKVSDWVFLILDDGSQNGIHRIWCVNCSGI